RRCLTVPQQKNPSCLGFRPKARAVPSAPQRVGDLLVGRARGVRAGRISLTDIATRHGRADAGGIGGRGVAGGGWPAGGGPRGGGGRGGAAGPEAAAAGTTRGVPGLGPGDL